jgi:hypothetical protein
MGERSTGVELIDASIGDGYEHRAAGTRARLIERASTVLKEGGNES